jgi:hypothetical protein
MNERIVGSFDGSNLDTWCVCFEKTEDEPTVVVFWNHELSYMGDILVTLFMERASFEVKEIHMDNV